MIDELMQPVLSTSSKHNNINNNNNNHNKEAFQGQIVLQVAAFDFR